MKIITEEGFGRFTMSDHTEFWKAQDAKNQAKVYGTLVEGKWYWYEGWIEKVREYCAANQARFQGSRTGKRKK